jgi:hypothetical protein
MDRTHELEDKVRRLTDEVDEMRARMAKLEREPAQDNAPRSNRRGFLKLGAGALMGALGWAAVKIVPAVAATGGYMLLGSANQAENPTTLVGDSGTPNPVLQVQSQGFSSSALTAALSTPFEGAVQGLGADGGAGFEGLDGWASGSSSYGVYGLTDAGYGVVGEANTGIALYARRSGRLRQEPLQAAGNPNYLPNNFEQVRDANGVLWIHNVSAGTNAQRWRPVNSVRVDAYSGNGHVFKPFRVIDTRLIGGLKAAGALYPVTVAGQGAGDSNVPPDAVAVVGNLTAVNYTGAGFLTIMPGGITLGSGAGQYNAASDPSSLNFIVGQAAIANSFVCGLSGGQLQVYIAVSSSHFIVDITGYIQ